MKTREAHTKRRIVGAAAAISLVAGSLVAIAPAATAAPGEITFFATGEKASGIAEDADGNLWVTNRDDVAPSISKVSLDGTVVTYPFPKPRPGPIARGADNAMWVAPFMNGQEQEIVRVGPDGSTVSFPVGVDTEITDVALGPDGKIWFTAPFDGELGTLTTQGVVTKFDLGGRAFLFFAPGPSGSNRMYVSGGASQRFGYLTMQGDLTVIDGPVDPITRIARINDEMWIVSPGITGSGKVYKVVNDRGFTALDVPQITDPRYITQGIGESMWVGQFDGKPSVNVSLSGQALASYPTQGGNSVQLILGKDGNLWTTVSAAGGVQRTLTGVVPTSTAAPAIEPASGLASGTTVTATNGTWNYRPSSYTYQWQICTSTDAATCSDIAGATNKQYTVTGTDVDKYLRVGVRATNLNGPSDPAYSGRVSTGTTPTPTPDPTPTPTPAPATGATATIDNGVSMELDAPSKQRRGKRAWYEVLFSATDVAGTVTFTIKKGSRTVVRSVNVEDGIAEYRWKTPRNWRKGRTTVTATYVPSAGSPYSSGAVLSRVRIR